MPTPAPLGLYGFMEGQELTKGEAELPAADIQLVKDTLAQMLAGKFTRFDVFPARSRTTRAT